MKVGMTIEDPKAPFKKIDPERLSEKLDMAMAFKANGSPIQVSMKIFAPERYKNIYRKKIQDQGCEFLKNDLEGLRIKRERSSYDFSISPHIVLNYLDKAKYGPGYTIIRQVSDKNIDEKYNLCFEKGKPLYHFSEVASNIFESSSKNFSVCRKNVKVHGKDCLSIFNDAKHIHMLCVNVSRAFNDVLSCPEESELLTKSSDMHKNADFFTSELKDGDEMFIVTEFPYNPEKPEYVVTSMKKRDAEKWSLDCAGGADENLIDLH